MGSSSLFSIIILVLLFLVMYFLMIRPQKKREKETQAMRSSVQVGDDIVTIGGICARVVKTKEESLVVQVGSDKVKMEIMRWAVSKVVKEGSGHVKKSVDDYDESSEAEANEQRKSKPRRMKKAATVEETKEESKEKVKEDSKADEPEAPEVAEVANEAEEAKEKVKEETAE